MNAKEIIRKKRDGLSLSEQEISFLIKGLLSGDIPDYQVSAFLMAVYQRGMTDDEAISLTKAMIGKRLDLSDITGAKIDKHSTGGVGDKTSIVLAPLLASMGVKVPKLSGRALGHTGGTIDKLESISGFRTDISIEEFKENLNTVGCSIMSHSKEVASADERLYALRDETATVESTALIASSIMSKKLSGGADGIVLDVKCGSGAFMKSIEDARHLARLMVKIGNSMGVLTVALITNMEEPLGRAVGNSLEIKECISALRGKASADLMELIFTLCAWMLNLADCIVEESPLRRLDTNTLRRYKHEAMDFIEKGDAFKKFVEMIDAQHGDPEVAFKPNLLPRANGIYEIRAPMEGYIRRLDALLVGTSSMLLGAGRTLHKDKIDYSAGIILNKKIGDYTKQGEPIAIFHYNDDSHLKDAEEAFISGLEIGPREIAKSPLILDVILPDQAG